MNKEQLEQRLVDAVNECWDTLRSAWEVSRREGKETNWPALQKKIELAIGGLVVAMGHETKMPNMCITAKTFRLRIDSPHIICPGCGNEIDPEVCWCGDYIKNHGDTRNHSPVPMGCDCLRDKNDPTPPREGPDVS